MYWWETPYVKARINVALRFSLQNVTAANKLHSFGLLSVKMLRVYIRNSNRPSWTQEGLNNSITAVTEQSTRINRAGRNLHGRVELFRSWNYCDWNTQKKHDYCTDPLRNSHHFHASKEAIVFMYSAICWVVVPYRNYLTSSTVLIVVKQADILLDRFRITSHICTKRDRGLINKY